MQKIVQLTPILQQIFQEQNLKNMSAEIRTIKKLAHKQSRLLLMIINLEQKKVNPKP
jgi:hypothetical protein